MIKFGGSRSHQAGAELNVHLTDEGLRCVWGELEIDSQKN